MSNSFPPEQERDELPDEIRFDYAKAKPNRFADQLKNVEVLIVLDPDVAAVFRTSESVNRVLRSLIENMPSPTVSE